ncbi:hypothetical protein D3C85_962960 [compost metagenome]
MTGFVIMVSAVVIIEYSPVTILLRKSLSVKIPIGSISSTINMAPTFFLFMILATSFAVVDGEQVTIFFEYFIGVKSKELVSDCIVSCAKSSPYNLSLWISE